MKTNREKIAEALASNHLNYLVREAGRVFFNHKQVEAAEKKFTASNMNKIDDIIATIVRLGSKEKWEAHNHKLTACSFEYLLKLAQEA